MATVGDMVHVDLTTSIGAIQIGTIFSIFLLGIVSLLWSLEVAHTACACYEVYRATITLYGQPYKYTTYPALGSTTATGGAITFLVQSFSAYRLTRVLPRPYSIIGWICIVLGVLRFIASVYLANIAMHATDINHYAGKQGWLISSLLGVGAGIDVAIALSMLWYLAGKRREGLERITAVIDKLMEYTIRTGALTSIWAVILLIMFRTMPGNWSWLAVYLVLAKLYSTSFLSSLNARVAIREKLTNSSLPSSERVSKHRPRVDARTSAFGYNGPQAISIEMNTTTKTIHDDSEPHIHDHEDRAYGADKRLGAGHITIVTPYKSRADSDRGAS
ncbi:hypothetical protein D9619_004772 [Psilocybe cf. subviscida]|uniref:DUF6534 domain-containing protein n=1 Tax=Psilocybe cf. subviscida TaxID=2480587 RepID=A0A8H5BRR1_9AGAR|nr:hypothetical protein D9619_004772 [Psilocybe cf. subviscida]